MGCIRLRESLVCALLLAVLPGCGGPSAAEDTDFQNLFKSLGQLCDRLDEVKGATSLKAAKPELDKLFKEIQDLDKKVDAIPEGKRKKLYERHGKLVQEVQVKHGKQIERQIRGELPDDTFQYLAVVAKEKK